MLEYSETIAKPDVTIAGDNSSLDYSSNHDNSTWQVVYTVKSGDNGTVQYYFSSMDLAGNSGSSITDANVGSEVSSIINSITLDTQAPALSRIHLQSNNNYDQTLAKVGDNITLSFDSSEALATPTADLAGVLDVAAIDNSSNRTEWLVSIQVNGSTPVDNVSFLFEISDLAGNKLSGISSTSDNSSV